MLLREEVGRRGLPLLRGRWAVPCHLVGSPNHTHSTGWDQAFRTRLHSGSTNSASALLPRTLPGLLSPPHMLVFRPFWVFKFYSSKLPAPESIVIPGLLAPAEPLS